MYGIVVIIRNFLYDIQFIKSYHIPGKSIALGNLSVGGTGKSPHTLYLWELIYPHHDVAILSRGYGRKTTGLIEVETAHTAKQVGDEPLMFKKRVGDATLVVVAEQRKTGVDYIRQKNKQAVILLDDAFQHRKVKAGFSILLTDFNQPYFSDMLLPSGNLREPKSGKQRATCLIVTKCPKSLSNVQKSEFIQDLDVQTKKVFFSSINYGKLVSFGKEMNDFNQVLIVSGIANPKPLFDYFKQNYMCETIIFPDHHNFSQKDITQIHAKFDTFTNRNSIIITTEKDFMRLNSLLTSQEKEKYPWHYQQIELEIEIKEEFNKLIRNYVDEI